MRVEFDTHIGPLRVMGMHLGLLPASRRQQITHIRRFDDDLDQMPTVWAGDFNEWSRQPVLDHLAPDMRFLPPVPSFPAAQPLGALDRIALGAGLEAVVHGVHDARPAHIASDHLPIWADLASGAGNRNSAVAPAARRIKTETRTTLRVSHMSDTIIARCEAKGLRMTGQRRTIAQVLQQSEDHPGCRGAVFPRL